MGKIKNLKQQIYGDFLKWLEDNIEEDPFSNEIWAYKIFDVLLNEFIEQKKQKNMLSKFESNVSEKTLKEMLDRKEKEKESREKMKKEIKEREQKTKNTIEKERERIVKERGKNVIDINEKKKKK